MADAPPKQMSYKEALDMAIFAVNTLIFPDGTSQPDFERLEENAEIVIETLVDMRSTVTGLP